jgi:hypothetical protein
MKHLSKLCSFQLVALLWLTMGVALTASAAEGDRDADGVPDLEDNCVRLANGPLKPDRGGNSQLDTNEDGYGNSCDADFDNDGLVDADDLSLMQAQMGSRTARDQDMNGNGLVDPSDHTRLQNLMGSPPGPSGPKDAQVAWQVLSGKKFAVDDQSVAFDLSTS